MPKSDSIILMQIKELQNLLDSLKAIAPDTKRTQIITELESAMSSLATNPLSEIELIGLSNKTTAIIQQSYTIRNQINLLQELRNSLPNSSSTPEVVSLKNELDNAFYSLAEQSLSDEELNRLTHLTAEITKKKENVTQPPLLEAQAVLSPKYSLSNKSTRRRKTRTPKIAEMDTFEAEERALSNAKNNWEDQYSNLTVMVKLLDSAEFSDIQHFPQVKELRAEFESIKPELESLLNNLNVDLKVAQEKFALNPRTQKPIREKNRFMLAEQEKTYTHYAEQLVTIKDKVSRINKSLHLIKADGQALDLQTAQTYYEQNKDSLNDYNLKFSKFTHMPHHENQKIESNYRNVEQLANEATQLIKSTLNVNNNLLTLAQLTQVTQQQTQALTELAALDETIILVQEKYTALLASIDKKSKVEQSKTRLLDQLDSYLERMVIPKIPYSKSRDESQNNFSIPLQEELEYVETIQNNIKEMNKLKDELTGINLSVISHASSDDLEAISYVVSRELEDYQQKINSMRDRVNGLKVGVDSSLENLSKLKDHESGRLQVILDKENKNIEELNQQLLEKYPTIDLSAFKKIAETNPSLAELYTLYNELYKAQEETINSINLLIQKERLAFNSEVEVLEKSLSKLEKSRLEIKTDWLQNDLKKLRAQVNELRKNLEASSVTESPTQENKNNLSSLQKNIKVIARVEHRMNSTTFTALEVLKQEIVKEKTRLINKYAPKALNRLEKYKKANPEVEMVPHINNRIIQLGINHNLKLEGKLLPDTKSHVDYTAVDYKISEKISAFIDPRLYELQALQSRIEQHQADYIALNSNSADVLKSINQTLEDALEPEKLAKFSTEKRGLFSGFIYKLINLITPEKYKSKLMSRSEKTISTAVQKFKQEIKVQKKAVNLDKEPEIESLSTVIGSIHP